MSASAPAPRFLAAGLAVVLGAAGCAGELDDYPLATGTGNVPGPQPPGTVLRGRVCLVLDLRALGTCAASGAGGLAITAGAASVRTAPDGTFELPRPAAADPDLAVTGPGVVPTFTPVERAAVALVPVVDADVFARELTSNGVLLPDGTGSILGRVTTGAAPAIGIGVTSQPAAPFGPFYDGTDAFTLDRTGARGVFFVPGLATGAAHLTFRDLATANETLVNGVMVRTGGITILDSVVLP
jgi:hypothetical protein